MVERDGFVIAGWGIRYYDEGLTGPKRSGQHEDSVLSFVTSQLGHAEPARVVFVSHLPPSGVRAARDHDGVDCGNGQLRSWVERVQPAAVICGHVHHPKAVVSRVGRTLVVNAGPHGYLLEL